MKGRIALHTGKKGGIRLSVGGSSILVIFVILTLTTFATLSLVSANADYNLSRKAMSAATEYYAADSQAEEMLMRIDTALAKITSGSSFLEEAEAVISAMDGVSTARDGDSLLATYTIPVNDGQELFVALSVTDSTPRYRRVEWRVITI
ncbi:MAG: hypothetical protein LBM60_02175 [Clostridium sp.]|jgi:hypothetical protein|nr:hypothetical protein [Clostridium sp.]